MINILILEDEKVRHEAFRKKFGEPGTNIVIVETTPECLNHLKSQKWDFLFLDHDLGGKINVPSGPGTGYEIAEFLERNPEYMPTCVVLHSYNAAGRDRMKQALPDAKILPGVWL